MTPTAELINAALARLDDPECWVEIDDSYSGTKHILLTKPLAALIRKAAEPVPFGAGLLRTACLICEFDLPGHATDCALIALAKAIVGESS